MCKIIVRTLKSVVFAILIVQYSTISTANKADSQNMKLPFGIFVVTGFALAQAEGILQNSVRVSGNCDVNTCNLSIFPYNKKSVREPVEPVFVYKCVYNNAVSDYMCTFSSTKRSNINNNTATGSDYMVSAISYLNSRISFDKDFIIESEVRDDVIRIMYYGLYSKNGVFPSDFPVFSAGNCAVLIEKGNVTFLPGW